MELKAKIKVVETRFNTDKSNIVKNVTIKENEEIFYNNVIIKNGSDEIYYNGKVVAVSPKEISLITYFIMNKGKILSRQQIMDYVWGADYIEGTDRVVDKTIWRLKTKFDILKDGIKTVKGIGYKLSE
jgi:DNA-binding response OmpR family regulator